MWRAMLIAVASTATLAFGADAQFKLTSPDIATGKPIKLEQVYKGYGCSGGNVSPALSWSNAPSGTQSFALLMHDPDAPTGNGWWHWVVYNIPASVHSLPANAGAASGGSMPAGAVQGRMDFGTSDYGGPCPPPGKPHHYHFQLYALRVAKLDVPANASAALIGYSVNANAIAKAELVPIYGR